MSNQPHKRPVYGYEIRLEGRLNQSWADWFDGWHFSYDRQATTILTGRRIDQAALHGTLKKVRDLGLPLISVRRIAAALDQSPEL